MIRRVERKYFGDLFERALILLELDKPIRLFQELRDHLDSPLERQGL